jgi:uncharacterized protein (DUF427 family)
MESVWDYPRPPRLEATPKKVRVIFGGETVAESEHCYRVLETSHPPVYYIPREDIREEFLVQASGRSFCEFKGSASYWSLKVGERVSPNAGWSYESPTQPFAAIRGFIAFYASRVDECHVDGELVKAQPGDFYGGWITSDITGPFKGGAGTSGW